MELFRTSGVCARGIELEVEMELLKYWIHRRMQREILRDSKSC